jgi:hypothetical protein
VEALVPERPIGAVDPVSQARLSLATMLARLAGRRPPYVLNLLRLGLPIDD